MNGVQTEDISAAAVPMDTALPAGWKLSEDTSAPGSDIDAKSNAAIEKALFEDKIVTGAGPDMDRAIAENNIPVYRLTASAETLVLTNEYHEGDNSLSAYEITVPDGVQTTVIEKFYSDDMKDWEETDSVEEAFGEDDHEEVREGELTFADRLKEAFGEPDGMKYGYDDECKECENWDEISEDCYCEDDCLTCEKPDQDKVKETAEAVAKVAEEAVAETVEEHEAAPAEEPSAEPSAEEPAEAPETPTEPVNPEA
jgi:hypothetical protein